MDFKVKSERTRGLSGPHPFETDAPTMSGKAINSSNILSGNYWGELRTFLAVAKAKSLTRAAVELNVSHVTVGREIRRLQDVLGAQLVVLSKAGAALTPRGIRLANELIRFDQTIYSVSNDLKTESKNTAGVVRVAITDGLGIVFVVPALPRLAAAYPRLQIHIKSPSNLRSLRENQTDIMIGFQSERSPDLTSIPLGWLHFYPFASSSYIARMDVPNFGNLHQHEFVDTDIFSPSVSVWKPWHDLVAQGRVAHRCDTSISYGMMVKAGLGIGLLGNYNSLEPCATALGLGVTISLQLFLVAVTERLDSKPVQVAANFLKSIFSEENPWFATRAVSEAEPSLFNEGYEMLFNLGSFKKYV